MLEFWLSAAELIGDKCHLKYWFKNPTNFEECKEATRGNIIKTIPAQCEFRGKNFTETKDETANWKTYRNEEYGFEVKYPNYYPPFTPTGGMDAEDGRSYMSKTGSIVSLLSLSTVVNSHPDLHLRIFNLDTYIFTYPLAASEYNYDPIKNQWQKYDPSNGWTIAGNVLTVSKNKLVGYKLPETGSIAYTYSVIVIPDKNKGDMIEIGLGRTPITLIEVPIEALLDQILSTFKFID